MIQRGAGEVRCLMEYVCAMPSNFPDSIENGLEGREAGVKDVS